MHIDGQKIEIESPLPISYKISALKRDQVRIMMKTKVVLAQDDLPTKWYNIASDLKEPLPPPLNPATKEPIGPNDLAAIFPMGLIQQEVSTEKFIDIPEEVLESYLLLGRPSPLQRAVHLEEYLKTPAKIYFKREDLSPTGSHKPNTAFAQAYYNMKEGVERITTETGAGQWGSALSLACNYFGLKCKVFMVSISYKQKPYRKHVMNVYGAEVVPSPSQDTEFGRKLLAENPDHPGSLGIAISEAIEAAVKDENTKYSLGSVLNHVLLHQTIVGLETKKQFEMLDITPDYMIGCVGGGSNFAGFAYPMMGEKLRGKVETEFIATEPTVVPSMTAGKYEYDFGDMAQTTPLLKMYTLGSSFIPPPIHAGGLRYHGSAPSLSMLVNLGVIKPVSFEQKECFDAGIIWARTEGVIPAPETNHALRAAINLALEAKKKNEEKIISLNFSGHGLLDLAGYDSYLGGKIK